MLTPPPRQLVFVSGAPGDRAATCHPVHVVTSVPQDVRAEYDQPVGIGKLVTVDTAVPVDVTAVAAAVRALWPGARAGELRIG